MKTIREYIDQLDEISRRDFLKGAAVGAIGGVVGDRYLNKKDGPITLPNDPTAYYLLGYQWGFSYLSPYNEILKQWLDKTGPYIGEVTLQLRSSGPNNLTQAYQKGFDDSRSNVKSLRDSGMSDKKIAEYFARNWETSYKKLISKLSQKNEEQLEETPEDPITKIDQLFRDK